MRQLFSVLLLSALGAALGGCPSTPSPCCLVDAECGDGLICAEGMCTIACASADVCGEGQLCVRQEGRSSLEGACLPPGGIPESGCNIFPPGIIFDGGVDGSCEPDPVEPNDTLEAAASVVEGTYPDLSLCSGDEDWYDVDIEAGGEIRITVTFDAADGEIDVAAFMNGLLVGESSGPPGTESLAVESLMAGHVLVRVSSPGGRALRYQLQVQQILPPECDAAFEPNDIPTSASVGWTSPVRAMICTDDVDYYALSATAGEMIDFELLFTMASADLDVRIIGPNGQDIAQAVSATDNEYIFVAAPSTGDYLIHIWAFDGRSARYTMNVRTGLPGICGDGVLQVGEDCDDGNTLNNDGCSSACDYERPPEWSCPAGLFDNGVCDCGCGALDVDCPSASLTACVMDRCPAGVDIVADENWRCELSGCGDGQRVPPEQCDDGNQVGGDGCNANCQLEVPTGWSCLTDFYADGFCDCGCGVIDADCASAHIAACDVDNCPDSFLPLEENNALCAPPACGDGALQPPEQCDDGNNIGGDGCAATCILETCGNGVLDPSEQCDDGNTFSGDGCSSSCLVEQRCGDGVVNPPEQCDDGNNASGDGCSATCQNEVMPGCGNGILESSEQCDDGNHTSGDGCSAVCTLEAPPGWLCPVNFYGDDLCDCGCNVIDVDCPNLSEAVCAFDNCPPGSEAVDGDNPRCSVETCGNGVIDPPEQCDDGNQAPGDGCSSSCLLEPRCGDGAVQFPEQCDDGNNIGGDGCGPTCLIEPRCGDGSVQFPEQCDDGNTQGGDGCSSSCMLEVGLCGNGTLNAGEECDDGNLVNGDGCSAFCILEGSTGWSCPEEYFGDGLCDCGCNILDPDCPSLDASVCGYNNCPNGSAPVIDDNTQCDVPTCGDGVVQFPEQCDDGNNANGDGCSAQCAFEPRCGDGQIQFPEQCDDGNNEDGDGCSAGCLLELGECGDGQVQFPEQCDDGNNFDGDGCSSFCLLEGFVCGDGFLSFPEQCDDGNTEDGDGCSSVCQLEVPPGWACPREWYGAMDGCDCGCGVFDTDCSSSSSNVCDYFNCPAGAEPMPDDNSQCLLPGCGNGQLEPTEDCDDGNRVNGDGCNSNCQFEPRCGNGIIEQGELCDDGNLANGDGCSAICFVEVPQGWTCEPVWFGDGICDCGCGIFDVADCPANDPNVCGFNSCPPPLEPDPNDISQCLEPVCPDDFFEENDSLDSATALTLGALHNAVLCPADPDFYGFELDAAGLYRVRLQYTAPPQMGFQLSLDGEVIDAVDGSGGIAEVFLDLPAGRLYVEVFGAAAGVAVPRPYALSIVRQP